MRGCSGDILPQEEFWLLLIDQEWMLPVQNVPTAQVAVHLTRRLQMIAMAVLRCLSFDVHDLNRQLSLLTVVYDSGKGSPKG